MRYLILRFDFVSAVNAVLPPFKGSMFRGAFGHALKKSECTKPDSDDCVSCNCRENCIFFKLFNEKCNYLPGFKNVPRPYVFRSDNFDTHFYKNDEIGAELVIYENMMFNIVSIVRAMKVAAESGFGVKKHPFSLKKAALLGPGWQNIVDEQFSFSSINNQPFEVSIPDDISFTDTVSGSFEILSPLQLKTRNARKKEFKPEVFLKGIIRKVSALSRFWGNDEWAQLNFKSLYKNFNNAKLLDSNLLWCDFKRYSNRQKRSFPAEGFLGHFVIENIPVGLLELLAVLDDIHIGKGAAWGLGRVRTIGFF